MIRKLLCRMRGHVWIVKFNPDRIYLECLECQRETTGWEIDMGDRLIRCGPVNRDRSEDKRVFDELMEIEIGLGCGG